ncbi:MAG: hypothetical protein CL933_26310 [Deltaproteobacteria bacterium]|nr:hypothetical protein [Deltaproteobacteria bacterium]
MDIPLDAAFGASEVGTETMSRSARTIRGLGFLGDGRRGCDRRRRTRVSPAPSSTGPTRITQPLAPSKLVGFVLTRPFPDWRSSKRAPHQDLDPIARFLIDTGRTKTMRPSQEKIAPNTGKKRRV